MAVAAAAALCVGTSPKHRYYSLTIWMSWQGRKIAVLVVVAVVAVWTVVLWPHWRNASTVCWHSEEKGSSLSLLPPLRKMPLDL